MAHKTAPLTGPASEGMSPAQEAAQAKKNQQLEQQAAAAATLARTRQQQIARARQLQQNITQQQQLQKEGLGLWMIPLPSPTAGPHPMADRATSTASTTPSRSAVGHAPVSTTGGPVATGQSSAADKTPAPGAVGGTDAGYVTPSVDQETAAINTLMGFDVSGQLAQSSMAWYTAENAAGKTSAQMQADMYSQPWFKAAFPGIAAQIANGDKNVTSPSQYMSDWQNARETLTANGVDPNVLSPELYGKLTGQGLTGATINARLALAYSTAAGDIANNHPALQELQQWYGIDASNPSAVAAFYLTGDVAHGQNVSQNLGNVTQAAEGGASAQAAGFSKLDQNTLVGMANAGVTASTIANAAQGASGALSATRQSISGQGAQASEADLLAAQGLPGVPGETQEQAAARVGVAAGQRSAFAKGGGGTAGSGVAGQTGTGYATQ